MQPLPIDALLPEVLASLARHPNLVLTAEPGAGKTTRVPPALLAAGPGEIVVLEPRRLAARLAATRVADERGEHLGGAIGYQVRFDERTSPQTQLRYVTEGILLRQLLSAPELPRVRAVVLDEFHERSLQSDLLVALLRRLQRERRPELSLIAMSATLDAAPVAAFLGGSPVLHAPGRLFPVRIEHAAAPDPRPLEVQVAAAVRSLLLREAGDILVFLPGMAEIRRAAARLGDLGEVLVLPLHGSLPPEAQDRAVRPNAQRKVILSTNVAETSLTIDGVTAVVDSGLARTAGHSAWSGLPFLKVAKISQAAGTQRAGRAGRTRPGLAVRLFTQADRDSRPDQETPEIRRADLAEPVLLLRALGVREPLRFPWYEAPAAAAIAAAETLLERLGAVTEKDLTPLGRRLASLPPPLHPRLGRVWLEAERRGVAREAAALVSLLQERDLAQATESELGDSDPLWQLERFREAEALRFSPAALKRAGLEVSVAQAVSRSADQLRRLAARPTSPQSQPKDPLETLRLCLLTGYPDRVARRRRPGAEELLLSSGGTALLSRRSVVKQAQLVVAVEAEEQRVAGESAIGTIRSASAIAPEWLLDLFPDRLREERRVRFNVEAERVDADSRLFYDSLVLDESRAQATREEMARALAAAALERGPAAYAPEGEPAQTLARVAFLRASLPETPFPALGPADVSAAVEAMAAGLRTFAELRAAPFVETLLGALSPAQRQLLESGAPASLALPSGRRVPINYEADKPPWAESRIQDFFGWTEGPRLAKGRVPLTLHLLAPNRRAVQVTADLGGFWSRHYPQIRKELSRRYPRHAWPEDPRLPISLVRAR